MSATLIVPPPMLISPPIGKATLPIVELDRKAVETDRKQIRLRRGSTKRAAADCSFGKFKEQLDIEAWPFFHAAKKTELTRSFTTNLVDQRALSFSDEQSNFLVWNNGNLRRVDRSVFDLEDFSGGGLAGRFGEAIAYLTMVKWGYVYWDRIAVLWERAADHSGMTQPEMVRHAQVISAKVAAGQPALQPDFAFEKSTAEVALMEAKGSFVHPVNDNPTTKDDLRHALKQLAAWSTMITPTPAKSLAIGTYFRDESDSTGDPSLLTFVDPPGERDSKVTPVEFPNDWIRRGNYGAWLIGMGLIESGDALRRGIGIDRHEQRLSVVTLGGRDFAITIEGLVVKRNQPPDMPFPMRWIGHWLSFARLWRHDPLGFMRDLGVTSMRVTGIDLSTLRLIEEAVANSNSNSLMQRDHGDMALAQSRTIEGFVGSILPDGSLLGEVVPELLYDSRMESFRL